MLDAIILVLIEIGLIHPKFGKKEREMSAGNRLLRFIVFVVAPISILVGIFLE